MHRLAAKLLVFTFLCLGTGAIEYLHNLEHAREDAREAAITQGAGVPAKPQPAHDESNCTMHAQLHLPVLCAAWVPLLICLGLFVAFLTELPHADYSCRIPPRIDCRGPPTLS